MNSYSPVAYVYYEVIAEAQLKEKSGNIHYFNEKQEVESIAGKIVEVEKSNLAEFLVVTSGDKARLDRVITIYGVPGPAYDEYDSYANQCLDCYGGWHFKDED